MAGGASEYLIVGTVQKPHGVRGELFVKLETDRPDVVFAAGRVLLLGDPGGSPLGGSLTVERARPFKGGFLLKVAGLTGLTPEVEALRGRTLLIPREEAAPLAEGEVFIHDLLGMEVRSGEEVVGTVHDVYDSPGGYLLAVRRPGKKGEVMIPFVEAVVERVDTEARTLELAPLPGLLEL
jgi:16S rRNA processing protein RimM